MAAGSALPGFGRPQSFPDSAGPPGRERPRVPDDLPDPAVIAPGQAGQGGICEVGLLAQAGVEDDGRVRRDGDPWP